MDALRAICVSGCFAATVVAAGSNAPMVSPPTHGLNSEIGNWSSWLLNFGHDNYMYPDWIRKQRDDCVCAHDATGEYTCREKDGMPSTIGDNTLTWCTAKQFLLDHMPEFDKYFMPPSVTVEGNSMFDDNIAFALMADNATAYAADIPLAVKLSYGLPYASYHESRVNWRPLFFAKFFKLVAGTMSTQEAMSHLVSPNVFLNWTSNVWESHPAGLQGQTDYNLAWSSSTSPPVINPFSFAAYGYSSCSGWATFVAYMAKALGIPARQVGTPCWNQPLGGVDYSGLARDNPNVTICWHGGIGSPDGTIGGNYLNNHNWVEYWDSEKSTWVFVNVPPTTDVPDAGLCSSFNESTGCDYSPSTGCSAATGPGLAMQDHEIFAITWSDTAGGDAWLSKRRGLAGRTHTYASLSSETIDGGPVIDVANLTLSDGEKVSPLVWSPRLQSPTGQAMKDIGLRVVNRTHFYRCRAPTEP